MGGFSDDLSAYQNCDSTEKAGGNEECVSGGEVTYEAKGIRLYIGGHEVPGVVSFEILPPPEDDSMSIGSFGEVTISGTCTIDPKSLNWPLMRAIMGPPGRLEKYLYGHMWE